MTAHLKGVKRFLASATLTLPWLLATYTHLFANPLHLLAWVFLPCAVGVAGLNLWHKAGWALVPVVMFYITVPTLAAFASWVGFTIAFWALTSPDLAGETEASHGNLGAVADSMPHID